VLTAPPYIFVAVAMMSMASYSAGAHLDRRDSLVGLAIVFATFLTVVLMHDPSDWFFPIAIFGVAPWVAGRTIRNQRLLARELAEKAELAEHAREDEERRAIVRERSRIARELHDVLAHNLSVMVVQAGGARRIVEKRPEQATEVADLIERTGREALAELRHLFGPVRHGDGEDLQGPVGIDRVEELAARARAAGLSVHVHVEGRPVDLPAGIDLTAYRVVQEALTNTLKHAGQAQASVLVSYEPNELVLSIEDDGDGSRDELGEVGGGHGLVGMRERVELYGGLLQAGSRPDGGFAVRVRLPTRPLVPA
jgi:signal transduction histidine kinase